MVRQWQQVFYNKRYSSTLLSEFDFINFAKACGADGVQVKTCEEFKAALVVAAKAHKKGTPFLIEAIVNQADLVLPMVAPGAVINDFVDPEK